MMGGNKFTALENGFCEEVENLKNNFVGSLDSVFSGDYDMEDMDPFSCSCINECCFDGGCLVQRPDMAELLTGQDL